VGDYAAQSRLAPGAWALLAVLAALYAFLYVWQPATKRAVGGGDFAVYLTSGRMLLAGRTPYVTPGWNYPPLISFLVAPLAALPFRTAWWWWFVLGHVCIGWAAWWTWRALGRGRRALWAVAVTWTAGHALAVSLLEGQVNPLLLVLLCMALWPPRRAPWSRGAAIAAAFALKVWPGILWAEDLLRGRWRRLVGGVALGAALTAAPLLVLACCFDGPLRPQRSGAFFGSPAFLNASLAGFAMRLADPPLRGSRLPPNWTAGLIEQLHISTRDRVLGAAASFTALVAGLALLALALRRRVEPPREPWRLGAALVALALVASPVSWPHYPVLQLPGTAALAYGLAGARRWRRLGALAVCFLAVNWTEALVIGPYVDAYGIVVAAPAVTWAITTLPVVGGVGLFVLHLLELRRDQRDVASSRLPAAATSRT
jgi:hypothetical protein